MSVALGTVTASDYAVLAGSLAIYSPLIGFAIREHEKGGGRTILLASSLFGAVLSIVAMRSGAGVRYAALTWLVLVVGSVLLPALLRGRRKRQWEWPAALVWLWGRPKILLYGLGLVIVGAICIFLGAAILGD
jgi:predicted anti-sigma-YlaC factor YlaD